MVAYFAAMNLNTGYKSVNILLGHAFSGLGGEFLHACMHVHTHSHMVALLTYRM